MSTLPRTTATAVRTVTSLVLSLAGLGISIYLTITHFDKGALVCATNGVINCEKVTTSPQSEILHIPVAAFGILFFAVMTVLCLPALWHSVSRRVHVVRLVLSVCGIGMVIYLVIVELFVVNAICLWCTSIHVITFILFILIASASPTLLAGLGDEDEDAGEVSTDDEVDVP